MEGISFWHEVKKDFGREIRKRVVRLVSWLINHFSLNPEELWPPKVTLGSDEKVEAERVFPLCFRERAVKIWVRSNPQRAGESPIVTLKLSGDGPLRPRFLTDLGKIARSDGAVLTRHFTEFGILVVVLPQRAERLTFADTLLRRVGQLLTMYDLQGRYC